jgi:hypothetical protein
MAGPAVRNRKKKIIEREKESTSGAPVWRKQSMEEVIHHLCAVPT